MFTTDEKCENKTVKLTRFESVSDVAASMRAAKYKAGYDAPTRWAGGTREDCMRKCASGNPEYAARAEPIAEKLANVAIETSGLAMEHNAQTGQLDVGAWLAGEPECLIDIVDTKTDRAPIAITLDMWISSTIPTQVIERRGVAAMALLQALSLYRPVTLYVVLANRHAPTGTDSVMVVPAPTSPMDVGRTSYMVADPVFVRQGLMSLLFDVAQSTAHCGIPPLSQGRAWQTNELPEWLAPKIGVQPTEMIHLPLLFGNGPWETEEGAQEWVTSHVKKYGG